MGLLKSSIARPELMVIARSPFHIYYEGPALAVSASNRIGDFDILPAHADFFSILTPGEVAITTGPSEPVIFNINSGILTVRENQVMLFVNM